MPSSHRGLRLTEGFSVVKACNRYRAIYWESCLTITCNILFLVMVLLSLICTPFSVFYIYRVSTCLFSFFLFVQFVTTRASPIGIPRDIYSLFFLLYIFFLVCDGTIVCLFCSLGMVTESGHFSIVPVACGRCSYFCRVDVVLHY